MSTEFVLVFYSLKILLTWITERAASWEVAYQTQRSTPDLFFSLDSEQEPGFCAKGLAKDLLTCCFSHKVFDGGTRTRRQFKTLYKHLSLLGQAIWDLLSPAAEVCPKESRVG